MSPLTHSGMLDTVRLIARRAGLQPSDLRREEHFDLTVGHDTYTDGLRVSAARHIGFGPGGYKAADIVIPVATIERASMRKGDRGIVDVVLSELEHLMTRLRLPTRPPKGWRLFGRRPRMVLA